MVTVKLSYSICNAWASGQWEQAVGYYLGQDFPPTPAMELGRLKDDLWSKHAKLYKNIHPEIGGGKLINPIVQQKYEKLIPFSDEYQILLRGVPDTLDVPVLLEYKCGMTTASQYIEKYQLDYYKLLLPALEIGYYLCFNPYNNTYTKGIKYLHQSNAENAMEHLITYGGELISYLAAQKLLKDYRG